MSRFAEFMADVFVELEAADVKHGDWKDRSFKACIDSIYDEVSEADRAGRHNDIDGLHGVKRESVQVAVTAFKLWRRVQ